MAKKRESSEKTSDSDVLKDADSSVDDIQGKDEILNSDDDCVATKGLADLKAAEDRYLRLAAEFENYKKRAQKDQAESIKFANERLLKDLLPVLDNLQRALRHVQQGGNINGLVQGVELTCKQYVEALGRFGVKPIPSVGLPFNPAVHQAVATVEAKDGQEPNTIVEEYEKGYFLYDRVLRPAMVTVAAAKSGASGESQSSSES